jgi:hypothetical protein
MDKIIDKLVNDLTKKELSINTIKSYKTQFNSLLELFNYPNDLKFLLKPEQNIKIIDNSTDNINTKASKINIILVLIKNFYGDNKDWMAIYAKYELYRDKLRGNIKEKQSTHEATDKQKELVLSTKEKEEIETQLKDQLTTTIKNKIDLLKLRNYIIYKTLTYLMTRLDIGDAHFGLYKKMGKYAVKYNWVLINKKEKKVMYYQNNFKTAKTEGSNTYTLDPEMYKYYVKYYNALIKLGAPEEHDNIYFLYNEDLQNKITLSTLSRVFIKLGLDSISKPLSIRIYRTDVASEDSEAIQKVVSKAKKMNHSVKTHIDYYIKRDLK